MTSPLCVCILLRFLKTRIILSLRWLQHNSGIILILCFITAALVLCSVHLPSIWDSLIFSTPTGKDPRLAIDFLLNGSQDNVSGGPPGGGGGQLPKGGGLPDTTPVSNRFLNYEELYIVRNKLYAADYSQRLPECDIQVPTIRKLANTIADKYPDSPVQNVLAPGLTNHHYRTYPTNSVNLRHTVNHILDLMGRTH